MVKYAVILLGYMPLFTAAQNLRFGPVKKLNSHINTRCEETFPLAAPDGKTFYFVRTACAENTGGTFTGADIWVSRYNAATADWEKPSNTRGVHNDKGNNVIAGVSGDGRVVYQLNTSSSKKIRGIYFSKLHNNAWTTPELIPISFLDPDGFIGLYVAPRSDIMFISMAGPGSRGKEDIYISTKDAKGSWSAPRNLGATINTAGFEISPFLSTDEKRLYFASNGHQGLGDADIFYSDRLDDTWEKWSAPVNLGDGINSEKFDAYFTMRDSVAYFSSNRGGAFADIYQATLANTDSTQRQIKKIVSEARSILADLDSETPDVPSPASERSVFIDFGHNSAEVDSQDIGLLNDVTEIIKHRHSPRITLVAESQNNELWFKRMEAIKNYFDRMDMPDLRISFELKKPRSYGGGHDNGKVEIRF